MGLDGISLNQLRLGPEVLSGENNLSRSQNAPKILGLSEDQKVDPDKDNRRNQDEYQSAEDEEELNEEDNDTEEDEFKSQNDKFDILKVDLSQANKYELVMNEESNSIAIIEKASKEVVQVITADKLAVFVNNLVQSTGAIVNRKF